MSSIQCLYITLKLFSVRHIEAAFCLSFCKRFCDHNRDTWCLNPCQPRHPCRNFHKCMLSLGPNRMPFDFEYWGHHQCCVHLRCWFCPFLFIYLLIIINIDDSRGINRVLFENQRFLQALSGQTQADSRWLNQRTQWYLYQSFHTRESV